MYYVLMEKQNINILGVSEIFKFEILLHYYVTLRTSNRNFSWMNSKFPKIFLCIYRRGHRKLNTSGFGNMQDFFSKHHTNRTWR